MTSLMWEFRNLFQKFDFFLWRGHFCTNLHEILAPGLKLILLATLFYKKIILTNRPCIKDPSILAQKQQKMAIFDKTGFPLKVWVQHETLKL